MSEDFFVGYAEKMLDHIRAEKLHRALAPHSFDGTELDHAIDRELPGLENDILAAAIKSRIKTRYGATIPLNTAIELVLKLLEDGALSS
jgi:hypothetical protein